MNFSAMVTQSVFARALAIFILALVMICAIIIATVDLLRGGDVPPIIYTIIGSGIGAAGTLIGINFGVILQPAEPAPHAPIPSAATGVTHV